MNNEEPKPEHERAGWTRYTINLPELPAGFEWNTTPCPDCERPQVDCICTDNG